MNVFAGIRSVCLVALMLAALPSAALAQSLQGWGVVLIHGKSGAMHRLYMLSRLLSAEGATVRMPSMSWDNSYQTYDRTLDEVAGEVAALRAQGVRKIALAGHSLGANVSVGYAAQRGGIDAVVAMAPGHRPELFGERIGDSLKRAKQMVAAGRGAEVATFADGNQGELYEVDTSAAAYVSFFDPAGPAVIGRNAGRLRGVKLLWLLGDSDGLAKSAPRGGRVITVVASHQTAPEVGAPEVVAWLRAQ